MRNQTLQTFATKVSNAFPYAMFCHLNSHAISFKEFADSLAGSEICGGFLIGTENNGIYQFVEIEIGDSGFAIEPADSMTGIKTLYATNAAEALNLISDMLADLHAPSTH